MTEKLVCMGCTPEQIVAADEAGMERMYKALFGDMDDEERADFTARVRAKRNARKDASLKKARALLKAAQHPVRRQDMILAMDEAIMHAVTNYERLGSIANAMSLVATVICRNMLLDGPLHEEG